jgi:hypothetical protein
MTIDDPEGMADLTESDFFFRPHNVKSPENLGEGYNITGYMDVGGPIVVFIEMEYYPADGGQPGYVHYTGSLRGDPGDELETIDQWSLLPAATDTLFRDLMAAHGIELQPAFAAAPAGSAAEPAAEEVYEPVNDPAPAVSEPQTVSEPVAALPTSTAAPDRIPYPALALAGGILTLLAGGLLLRRRALAQRNI